MRIPLLTDIVLIIGLSIFVLFIFHRLRLPTIVGFLLTGMVAGPHGLGLVKAVHEVEILAEIGVILLLFTIGIEFSLKNLLRVKRSVLLGGSLQVGLTLLSFSLFASLLGLSPQEALFIGCLVALSSTAIVLKLIQEGGEVESPYGQTSLAILIYQDIIIVPMILFTPLLAGALDTVGISFLVLLVKGVAVILIVILGAEWVVPRLLYHIAQTRSRELFLLAIIAICFTVAWLTSRLGLSLSLGAFLAGLIISESEYSPQAFSNVLPFLDLFSGFFFISIGMLLDIQFLFQQPGVILLMALGVLILKSGIAGMATALLGFPLRIVVLVGFTLSQVGEFSFILSMTGIEHGLLSGRNYQLFLAVSVLTMAATPFVIALAPKAADLALRAPLPKKLKFGLYAAPGTEIHRPARHLKDHLIIVGFGVNGRNVALAARMAGVPYAILEMNPETVRRERGYGEPIGYGDATQEAILDNMGVRKAKILVVAIADPAATRRITSTAKQLNPGIHIIARTRYLQEVESLYKLGAEEVIPEEFETSVEIFTRVLAKFSIPEEDIVKLVAELRSNGYEILRRLSKK